MQGQVFEAGILGIGEASWQNLVQKVNAKKIDLTPIMQEINFEGLTPELLLSLTPPTEFSTLQLKRTPPLEG
jgi:hypothetical protein